MSRERPEAPNWRELREAVLRKTSGLFAAVAWASWYSQRSSERLNELAMGVALLVGLVCLAVSSIRSRRAFLPAAVVILLPSLFSYGAYAAAGYSEALPFLAMALVLCPFVLPWYSALAAALACAFLPAALGLPALPFPTAASFLASAAAAALIARQHGLALRDSWAAAERSGELLRELQASQERINRLNRALTTANGLLKRSMDEAARAQREADEARKLKERFATTVSHELRTPLNIILGFIEMMQRYPEVYRGVRWTRALRQDLAEIGRNAKYLSELVDDILDLARLQALKLPIRRELTELGPLLEETVRIASRLLLAKPQVALRLELPQGLPALYVDPLRIRQVILNILANACRFTEEGEIVVRACQQGSEVVVSVADTGPGIGPQELERIFDEFSQAGDPALDEKRRLGKGLGLAIAKRFVQLHGGRIWVTSTLGKGSCFYVALPLTAKEVALLQPPEPHYVRRLATQGKPTIVLVDRGNAEAFLSRQLEEYVVVKAPDLLAARHLAQELNARAVIVNGMQDMPQGGAISPEALNLPVPLIACPLPVSQWHAPLGAFDDWLTKPIGAGELFQTLSRAPDACTILIADDDRSFVRLVRRMLEGQGTPYKLRWAYDAQTTIQKLQEEPVDVLLLDIGLPGMDGRLLARSLKQGELPLPTGAKRPRIVAVTALQPSEETLERPLLSFLVSCPGGLKEEDTLALLRYCLKQFSSERASQLQGPQAAESAIEAS